MKLQQRTRSCIFLIKIISEDDALVLISKHVATMDQVILTTDRTRIHGNGFLISLDKTLFLFTVPCILKAMMA